MASNEQSVTLLQKNKRAQIEALNSVGFSLTDGARAADFADLVKWGAGLLDLNVAANRISDNKKFFFTLQEWQSLSATEQALFLLRGIRVRACAQSFIIAPETIQNKAWGNTGVAADLHSYSSQRDLYFYYDAVEETRIIVEAFAGKTGTVIGAPAAEAAIAYKAFTLERDGLEDTSEWCLPTPAHLMIMGRWRPEIDAAFTAVWSQDFKLQLTSHWSCGRWDTTNVYAIWFNACDRLSYESATTSKAVRPICPN